MWYARNQVLEHAHQVPEKVYADEVRVFRDALERRWEQRRWRRVLQDAEVQHEQELQCFGLLCGAYVRRVRAWGGEVASIRNNVRRLSVTRRPNLRLKLVLLCQRSPRPPSSLSQFPSFP